MSQPMASLPAASLKLGNWNANSRTQRSCLFRALVDLHDRFSVLSNGGTDSERPLYWLWSGLTCTDIPEAAGRREEEGAVGGDSGCAEDCVDLWSLGTCLWLSAPGHGDTTKTVNLSKFKQSHLYLDSDQHNNLSLCIFILWAERYKPCGRDDMTLELSDFYLPSVFKSTVLTEIY